jgi:hypothetical protein
VDTRILLLLGSLGLGGYAACSIYDPSLVMSTSGSSAGGASASGSQSGSADGSASSASGTAGGGSVGECVVGKDCPGADEPCKTRTCNAAVCGVDFAKEGTPVDGLGPGGCSVAVCDGKGAVQCVPDQCGDMMKNGNETDVDCGGDACTGCDIGKTCAGNTDCVSQTCAGGTCQTSCSDGTKNGNETDKDCGGDACPACATGKICGGNVDCLSGKCSGGACVDVLLFSEIQTRGTNGGNDEFIEIYNPTNTTVIFDSSWTVTARSAVGTCSTNQSTQRFAGSGQSIAPHRHLLFTNNNSASYNGPVAGDATYNNGVNDAGEIVLHHGGTVVDAVCYFFDATTQNNLKTCSPAFTCEGTPVDNAPHDNVSDIVSNVDVTLDRAPGGLLGNGDDTGNNAADFTGAFPANPQNLTFPPTPP